jgi:hypothetical protein
MARDYLVLSFNKLLREVQPPIIHTPVDSCTYSLKKKKPISTGGGYKERV